MIDRWLISRGKSPYFFGCFRSLSSKSKLYIHDGDVSLSKQNNWPLSAGCSGKNKSWLYTSSQLVFPGLSSCGRVFPVPSCIFLILKSGQFPSRLVVVQNKCIAFGISPSVPYPFVELFSSAPPLINFLTTAQGLNHTHFTCFVPLVYSNLAIRLTTRRLL